MSVPTTGEEYSRDVGLDGECSVAGSWKHAVVDVANLANKAFNLTMVVSVDGNVSHLAVECH